MYNSQVAVTKRPQTFLLAVLMAILAMMAVSVVAPTPAHAATPTVATSETINGVKLERYVYGGMSAVCMDFGLASAGMASASTVSGASSAISGLTVAQTRQLTYLVNRMNHPDFKPTTVRASTNYALAAYRVVGNAKFMSWWNASIIKGAIPAARVAEVNFLVNEARNYGISKVVVTAGQVFPGQQATGSVAVYAANGTLVPRAKLSITGTSVSFTSRATTTGTTGKGAFAYLRTSPNAVTLAATASRPSALTIYVTKPYTSAGQRFVYGNFTQSAKGLNGYQKLVGLPTITSSCSTDCDGNGTMVVKPCAPTGNYRTVWQFFLANTGATVGRVDAAPGTCPTVSFPVKDAMQLRLKHFNNTLAGVYVPGSVVIDNWAREVVCPAWPKGTITVAANCTECTASVGFDTPVGRHYLGKLELGNSAGVVSVFPYTLVGGTKQTFALKDSAGRPIKVVPGTILTLRFSAFFDAAHTRPIPNAQNKLLVSIQVLATASDGTSTYKVTSVATDGSYSTKTVTS